MSSSQSLRCSKMTRWDSNTHINDPSCWPAPGCLALTQHVSTNTFLSKQTQIHMIYLALRLRTQQQVGRPIFVSQLSHQRNKIVFYQNEKVDLKKSSQNPIALCLIKRLEIFWGFGVISRHTQGLF